MPKNEPFSAVRPGIAALALLLGAAWPGCSCNSPTNAATNAGSNGGSNGSNGGSTCGTPAGTLSFVPPQATLVLSGSGSQSASFTLQFTPPGGQATNVTATSIAFDRPDLAMATPGEPVVVTAPSMTGIAYGGTGQLHAVYNGLAASATVNVRVQAVDYADGGLSSTSPGVTALAGDGGLPADPAFSSLLYPYDLTVWPLGLTSPLMMFNAPQADDVYRLHYEEKDFVFDGYYTLASLPGQLRLPQQFWDRITASNDTSNGADPLSFTLSRWDSVAKVAYQSARETWTIAPASLQGAIYYWTVNYDGMGADTDGHITMFQPGTGAQPLQLNSGNCMGCHAVNAQGTVLVADVDAVEAIAPYGSNHPGRSWASFDITNAADAGAPLVLQTTEYGADVAVNPDGVYTVFGSPTTVQTGGGTVVSPAIAGSKYISLAETATGKVVANSGLDDIRLAANTGVMMPAFSPDGTRLALIQAQFYADNVLPNNGGNVVMLDFDESGPSFSPTVYTLARGNDPIFGSANGLGYPSFAPNSQAVAFHAGTASTGCTGSCDNNAADDGNLYMVGIDGGTPIRLAAACDPPNASDDNSSVEPTFNPQARGGYAWVVFTSMRAWGNQPWPSDVTVPATGHINGERRLWAAAIDPVLGTVDPSHPAFYLEGQEDRPNMRGFWSLASCLPSASNGFEGAGATDAGAPCTQGFQCCSGFCVNGQCASIGQVACVSVDGTCSQDSDCCNSPPVTCTQGVCQQQFE